MDNKFHGTFSYKIVQKSDVLFQICYLDWSRHQKRYVVISVEMFCILSESNKISKLSLKYER